MSLYERISADSGDATKRGDVVRRDTLRLLLAALHNREIEKRSKGDEVLTDDDVCAVVEREVKKRKEAIEFYEKGNRPAQAEKERGELSVLEGYLPPALDEAAIDRLVEDAVRATGATTAKDMGRVMAEIKKAAKGARMDGGAVSAKVRAKLGA